MYRIRRESGDEIALGSIDEFAAAVVAGTITAKAEIYHARAERWLPIASHPHFKMAQDRASGTAPRATRSATASGQRPAVPSNPPAATSSPAPPAPRPLAPQLRVVRSDAPAAVAPKAAQRWAAPQRAATAAAPKPVAPPVAAPDPTGLQLVQADAIISPPDEPEMEFELLPADAPAEAVPILEPVAPAPELVTPETPMAQAPEVAPVAAVVPVVEAETVVERASAEVQLIAHEDKPAAERTEVELIHPDRSMPVVTEQELPQLEIPAPIQDFGPVADQSPAPRSRAPLFIGLGIAAAAAAAIAFFAFKPSSAAPTKVPPTPVAEAPVPKPSAPAAQAPATPKPVASAPSVPTGSSAGLGGDAPKTRTDGLEPPPMPALPKAPKLGSVGDAAALPTVDAQSAGLDRAKALEKTRREIDSSMRQ